MSQPLASAHAAPLAEELLDELLPRALEWRRLAIDYPRATLLTAAATGFWLGRQRGAVVVSAIAAFASGQVADALSRLFEGEEDLDD